MNDGPYRVGQLSETTRDALLIALARAVVHSDPMRRGEALDGLQLLIKRAETEAGYQKPDGVFPVITTPLIETPLPAESLGDMQALGAVVRQLVNSIYLLHRIARPGCKELHPTALEHVDCVRRQIERDQSDQRNWPGRNFSPTPLRRAAIDLLSALRPGKFNPEELEAIEALQKAVGAPP